jgi:hypothetical protein
VSQEATVVSWNAAVACHQIKVTASFATGVSEVATVHSVEARVALGFAPVAFKVGSVAFNVGTVALFA